MARRYRNGEVPVSWLIEFDSGYNSVDGAWVHSLPPSTYRKHLALVALAKRNTGRDLRIGVGWCAYRPIGPQRMLKKRFGIMAATPGTSSHGGFWENEEVMAIDYGNWSHVYAGNRAAWFRDVRAVGLVPDMISPRRGYPDEPWHVIDRDPWAAVPSGGNVSRPGVGVPTEPIEEIVDEEEDEMKPRQIHYVQPNGKIVRAEFVPGTSYFVPWGEGTASVIANALSTSHETGASVLLPQKVWENFRAAAEAMLPKDRVRVEIVDAES